MIQEILKFMPSTFNAMSLEEKQEAIQAITIKICENLKVEPIKVDFSIKLPEKVCGKFFHYPKGITINLDYILKQDFLHPAYQTLFTVAHECYHYFEYTLIDKFTCKENLTKKQKMLASTYFVSLYRDIFIKICEDKNLLDGKKVDQYELYKDTICEADANEFAYKIMNSLTHLRLKEKERILLIDVLAYCDAIRPTSLEIINALKYEKEVAIRLLKYKKNEVKRNDNYLNIDMEELEKLINKKISSLRENLDGNEKLLLRIKK